MKRLTWGSVVFRGKFNVVRAIGVAAALGIAAPAGAASVTGTVTKVSDGDTIHVKVPSASKPLKIRMIGIDTPELHFPAAGGWQSQGYWAEQAQIRLAKLIPLKAKVTLETYGTDKYGRTLARIYRGSKDINLELVREGLALPYIICEGKDCDPSFFRRHDVDAYLDACEDAEKQQIGIFDANDPLPEMPFEFRMRIQKRDPDKYVGDVRDETYREPDQYKRVPKCSRIFFMKESDATKAGYRPF